MCQELGVFKVQERVASEGDTCFCTKLLENRPREWGGGRGGEGGSRMGAVSRAVCVYVWAEQKLLAQVRAAFDAYASFAPGVPTRAPYVIRLAAVPHNMS